MDLPRCHAQGGALSLALEPHSACCRASSVAAEAATWLTHGSRTSYARTFGRPAPSFVGSQGSKRDPEEI